jgi:hypothetical protein
VSRAAKSEVDGAAKKVPDEPSTAQEIFRGARPKIAVSVITRVMVHQQRKRLTMVSFFEVSNVDHHSSQEKFPIELPSNARPSFRLETYRVPCSKERSCLACRKRAATMSHQGNISIENATLPST